MCDEVGDVTALACSREHAHARVRIATMRALHARLLACVARLRGWVPSCLFVSVSVCMRVSESVVSVSVSMVSGLAFAYMCLASGRIRSASSVLFAESYLRRPYKDCQ